MTEEQVFLALLDLPDAAARAAYLDQTCSEDAAFRKQVESLLAAHFKSGQFLDVPAGEQLQAGSGTDTTMMPGHSGSAGQDDDESERLQFLTPTTRPDSLGRIGHYEVLQVLGKGGFGIVFRAFDEILQRVVAIKVMAPQMAATSPARKRFLREARTSAAVRHENVVQVYEVGEQPLPYLVMEFIPGETLQQRLDRTGPLDAPETLRIGRQIAEGLAAAHANDLIHRDIKPGNVLLEGGQHRVKITDFGLARAADDASMTQSGMIAGTPMYMAPEQALGHKLDQRADLFSLGSVLYQMVAGRPPFRANSTVAVLKRVADDTPRSIRDVIPETPQWLCDIIAKLHAKQPEDRFQSARELADVLADCEAQLKTDSRLRDFSRIPIPPRIKPKRSYGWKVAAACIFVALAGLSIWAGPFAKRYAANQCELNIQMNSAETWHVHVRTKEGDERAEYALADTTRVNARPGTFYLDGLDIGSRTVETLSLVEASPFGKSYVRYSDGRWIMHLARGERVLLTVKVSESQTAEASAWSGWPKDAPRPAIAPFNAAHAEKHQKAWATYLGVPVEHTNSIGMKFRLIPPGEFLMGSTPEEVETTIKIIQEITPADVAWREYVQSESAQHLVTLTQPFYLSTLEVTQQEYETVMGANPALFAKTGENPETAAKVAGLDTAKFAVENIRWNDAAEFCANLSQRERLKPIYFRSDNTVTKLDGNGYRLPTEAQWEFACRAGTTTKFSCGGDEDRDLLSSGWFWPNANQRIHAVGELKANPFGLFDMYGNAAEWVEDIWGPGYYEQFAAKPARDPVGAPPGAGETIKRVIRGGFWWNGAIVCRSGSRFANDQLGRSDQIGFRVALSVDAVKAASP